MKLFGPLSITHNAVALPDTTGGAIINFIYLDKLNVGEVYPEKVMIGGSGEINFFEWDSSIDITLTTVLETFGETILTGTTHKITLYNNRLSFAPSSISVGRNELTPIVIAMDFKPASSGQIIKVEEV